MQGYFGRNSKTEPEKRWIECNEMEENGGRNKEYAECRIDNRGGKKEKAISKACPDFMLVKWRPIQTKLNREGGKTKHS